MPVRRPLLLAVFALCAMLPPQPTAAAVNDFNIAAEIDALTVAVNRLATVMEHQQSKGQDQVQLQKLTQAIAYLNFRTRRIEQLEHDLSATRLQRDDLEQLSKTWIERIGQLDLQLKNAQGQERDDLSRRLDEFKSRNEITRKRLSRTEEELVMLENRVRELQNELTEIETFVERNLRF